MTPDGRVVVVHVHDKRTVLTVADLDGKELDGGRKDLCSAGDGGRAHPVVLDATRIVVSLPNPSLVDLRRFEQAPVPLYDGSQGDLVSDVVAFPSGRLVALLSEGTFWVVESPSLDAPTYPSSGEKAASGALLGFDEDGLVVVLNGTLTVWEGLDAGAVPAAVLTEVIGDPILIRPPGSEGAVVAVGAGGSIVALSREAGSWSRLADPTPEANPASILANMGEAKVAVLSLDGGGAQVIDFAQNPPAVVASYSLVAAAGTSLLGTPDFFYASTTNETFVQHPASPDWPYDGTGAPAANTGRAREPLSLPDGSVLTIGGDGRIRRFPGVKPAGESVWGRRRANAAQTGWARLSD